MIKDSHYLGVLCKRGHDHEGTGQSVRFKSTGQCIECHREWCRQYDKKHPDAIQERSRKYYYKHRQSNMQRKKDWSNTQRGIVLRAQARGRSLAQEYNTVHKPYDVERLLDTWSFLRGACAYCGILETLGWDHFIPLKKDGHDADYNLVPCCRRCNTSKNDRDPFLWYSKQPYYQPTKFIKIITTLEGLKT